MWAKKLVEKKPATDVLSQSPRSSRATVITRQDTPFATATSAIEALLLFYRAANRDNASRVCIVALERRR